MDEPFQFNYESLEDFHIVHEHGGVSEPSVGHHDFERDNAPAPEYLREPHYSLRSMSYPPHQSSDSLPGYATDFSYRPTHYASSEPSLRLRGSTFEPWSKDNGYHHETTNRDSEECRRRLDKCLRELDQCHTAKKAANKAAEENLGSLRMVRIRLFQSLREAKKYGEAEEVYHEIMTGRADSKSEDAEILDLKHCFAGMLIEQEKFQEAEPISRAVWEERKQCLDPPSEVCKQSHRQLCSVLCAMGRHKDAENMHRGMYQRGTMDVWALENGDEICQRLREQGGIRRAKEMQDEVWKERLKQHGPRDSSTIQSGLRLIEFLEELVVTMHQQGANDAERRLNNYYKKVFEFEIEVILRNIWATRLHPEPITDILNAGHKLGTVLFLQNMFSDAEAIFTPVWEGRKQRLGDGDGRTMSTGSMLAKALCRQEKEETYRRAVDILQGRWFARETVIPDDDIGAMSSIDDLARAYFSLRDWPNAEATWEWIVQERTRKPGSPTREINDAQWNLGQALYQQGKNKNRKAETVLRNLYDQWNASSPNSSQTLQCGQMLAQSLSTQKGRIHDALEVALNLFNRRKALGERGVAYLDGGRLYGSLLLEVENFAEAERILKSMWEHQAKGDEEQKMRLKCGNLFGQALAKGCKYVQARKTLEAVAAGQGAILPAENPESVEVRRLLQDVNQLQEKAGKGAKRKGSKTVVRRQHHR